MPQPLSHLYDLALRALDEQERRADDLRGRLAPMLAAAALGAAAYLLGARRRMSFETDMHRLVHAYGAAGLLDDGVSFYIVTIRLLSRAHDLNAEEIGLLERAFTWMLWSILVMLCGLAVTTIVG